MSTKTTKTTAATGCAVGFDPARSRVSPHSLAEFIRAPLQGKLSEVPGVGQATERALRNAGVSTTFQLVGQYLMLKEEGVGPVEHADRFYYWLSSLGSPAGFRAGVVQCIAEKMNVTFPGIYDPSAYLTTIADRMNCNEEEEDA